ncbi:GNAT family N-acetyltransferase [Amycolatopsis sp. NPDC021455]|uniref:GNAT family N-acetyltransferase n=1 Tax=Amycolatopsis sp. NPDC021455 TaxID=3154901 RepID=UPI0033D32E25
MKPGQPTVVVTRVAERQWHALDDDRVVGRGEASPRPDGRLFLSIDVWHDAVFDRLAGVMLPALPRPLSTVVGEDDVELTSRWRRAGFAIRRREWEYLVPTAPAAPSAVTIVPGREADIERLRELDRAIRAEVEAGVGWHEMPAEVLPRIPALDPSKYTIAANGDEYVGFLRLAPVTRQPRIGLVAVRAAEQRRGIGRALLTHVLGALHDAGIETASAEVSETNAAATALFDSVGARRTGSNLELVLR